MLHQKLFQPLNEWKVEVSVSPENVALPHQQPAGAMRLSLKDRPEHFLKASQDIGEKVTSQLLILKFWVGLSFK